MTVLARRRFCMDCGFTVRQGKSICSACGSERTPLVGEFITPTREAKVPSIHPPHPWTHLDWPEGATISLAARQGLGKSSAAMLLNQPDLGLRIGAWFSTEQDPYQVVRIATRLGVPTPPILSLPSEGAFDAARRALADLNVGPGSVIVFDSLTQVGNINEAVAMMNLLIAHARIYGYRVIMINQTNKAEQVAGSNKLVFNPDIDVRITTDKFGRRRLYVGKNRYGVEYTRYFHITREGKIELPDFGSIVHTVEGIYPDLELVPYGLAHGSIPGKPGQARGERVQWAGILDPLAEWGLLAEFSGRATAGAESLATKDGFMYPPDWEARAAFGEEHGQKWLPFEEIRSVLEARSGWKPLAERIRKRRERQMAKNQEKAKQRTSRKED